MALRLRRFVVIDRKIVTMTCQVDRCNHLAVGLLRTHADVIGNLEVLLGDLMVMGDRRKLSHLRCKRRLQVSGRIFMHRLELHVDYRRLVAEIDMFLAKHTKQVFGEVFGDEGYVLRVIHQYRLVALFEARRQGQHSHCHPNEAFQKDMFHNAILSLFQLRTTATFRVSVLPLFFNTK